MRFDDFCPDDWDFKTIEERCSLITSGGTPLRSNKSFYTRSGGIPWIKTKELNNRFIFDTEEHITEQAVLSSSAKILPKNSVLIAMYGATVGELGILAVPMACNQACCSLTVEEKTNDERFLFYQLLSKKQEIKGQAVGAAQQNISAKFIRSIELPTPPVHEQKAIAHILGTLDNKIEINQKMNQNLEETAKALFKSWFIDFDPVKAKAEGRPTGLQQEISDLFPDSFEDSKLGEIPKGWKLTMIKELFETVKGSTPPTKTHEFWNSDEFQWFSPRDLSDSHSTFLINSHRKLSEKGLKKITSGLLSEKTVLFSSRAPIGYINILSTPSAIGTGLFGIKCNEKYSYSYIYCLFQTLIFKYKQLSIGSTFEEISKKIFDDLIISTPNNKLGKLYSEIIDPVFEKILINQQEILYLQKVRDTLLPKLISGKLRIKDAEKYIEEADI